MLLQIMSQLQYQKALSSMNKCYLEGLLNLVCQEKKFQANEIVEHWMKQHLACNNINYERHINHGFALEYEDLYKISPFL